MAVGGHVERGATAAVTGGRGAKALSTALASTTRAVEDPGPDHPTASREDPGGRRHRTPHPHGGPRARPFRAHGPEPGAPPAVAPVGGRHAFGEGHREVHPGRSGAAPKERRVPGGDLVPRRARRRSRVPLLELVPPQDGNRLLAPGA